MINTTSPAPARELKKTTASEPLIPEPGIPSYLEIYIVDDSEDFRYLARSIFQKYLPGYKFRIFASGQSLYQHLMFVTADTYTGALPGLIVLDFLMPGIDGLNLLKLIRQRLRSTKVHWKTLPVIILSSVATDEQALDCYQAGATSVITKPADLDEYRKMFETVCSHWLKFNQQG